MYIEEIFKRYVLFTSQQVFKKVNFFQQTSIYSPHLSVSNLFSTVWESHLYKGTFFGGMFFSTECFLPNIPQQQHV